MDLKTKQSSPAGLIDIGAFITSFVAAFIGLIYTAGWSYGYHYFSRFHVGLLGMDIKREYFLLYGFWVLKDNLFAVLAILLGSGCLVFLYSFLCQATEKMAGNTTAQLGGGAVWKNILFLWRPLVIWIGGPLYFLFLFIVFYHLGTSSGHGLFDRQAANGFPSYPRVRVHLVQKASDQNGQQHQELARGCYRLLLHTQNFLYLFYDDGMSVKIPTEIIPTSRVEMVRVLPQYQSSEECR